MIWIILGIVIIIAVGFLILKANLQKEDESEVSGYPYTKKDVLFSPAERSFLGVLSQSVGDKAQIFGKVRVADVITTKKGLTKPEQKRAFNKIASKHFDFILCDKNDLSIMCAIELNDSSHQSKNRQDRDSFLEGVCKAAFIPLVQVQARSSYSVGEIKILLFPYLNSELLDKGVEQIPMGVETIEIKTPSIENKEKTCPKCSAQLVKRVAKKGDKAGNEFWACSAFPRCRHTEAVNA